MSKSWYPLKAPKGNNKLVLWRWHEALAAEGFDEMACLSDQLEHTHPGDRLFITATTGGELYLLGTIDVKMVKREQHATDLGEYRADGPVRTGAFGIYPLGALKWQLRFERSAHDRIRRNASVAQQVRRHRYLAPKCARLLLAFLAKVQREQARETMREFIEGERRLRKAYQILRDRRLRAEAQAKWGTECYCCGFDFKDFYGDKGSEFVIVHHVDQLADRNGRARATTVQDVRVVCANCHAIIHRVNPPLNPNRLRSMLGRRWGRWSERGVRAMG